MRTTSLFLLAFLGIAASRAEAASKPRLVVVIVIDQFRADYVERFAPYFSRGGFRRFLDRGANFPNTFYQHSIVSTAPGHASIATGLDPSEHGVLGNDWYDRSRDATVYCVFDARSRPSMNGAIPRSPLNLSGDALGDRVIEADPKSKVIGVARKDRTAILLGGRKATAAYWMDDGLDLFVSSSYYRYNPTIFSFNRRLPAYMQDHMLWEQSSFIPAADLGRITFDPPELRKFKTDSQNLGVSFPHPVRDLDALEFTPFGNELAFLFATHVIDVERLGTDDHPDLLYVGLSSQDDYGHSFGPDSLEVADAIVRTDRYLETFLNLLEKRFGSRVTVALSSDHGVQSIPEIATARGREAGRFAFRGPSKTQTTIGVLSPNRKRVEYQLAEKFGFKLTDEDPIDNKLIKHYGDSMVYLNWPRIKYLKLDGEEVKNALKRLILDMKPVAAVFTNTELLRTDPPASPLQEAIRRSFRADRSGDLVLALKPGYTSGAIVTGTNHREPVPDDQHVPLMFWGAGIKPGSYTERVAPTDIARTLGAVLGIDAGGAETRILPCVSGAPPATP